MPLDIWIGDWNSPRSKLVLSFENEAYYWFIEPIIAQSHDQGGKWFDLYDGAEFRPDELHHVEGIIALAMEQVRSKPQEWDVKVGTQLKPEPKDLFVRVRKQQFLDFLSAWKCVADSCREQQKSMSLYGD